MNDVVAAVFGGMVGVVIVLMWTLGPVLLDIARHGWRNDR